MAAEYDLFQRFPDNKVVEIGFVSGWENLRRTLNYYAKLSSTQIVAVDRRAHAIFVAVDGFESELPTKRAKATAA
jgi:hypothetical protein